MDCVFGTYPSNDSHTTPNTSILGPTDFLQRFNDLGTSTSGQTPTFHTFLAALQTTGLTDLLATGGPYLLFVPTDDAFAALPEAQRQALLADPQALAAMVRSHIVAGYFPVGALGTNGLNGGFNRTVTNLLGTPLVLTGGDQLIVNGKAVGGGGDYAMVANGTRLFWTSKLIGPLTTVAPAPSATPMPPTATLAPPTSTPPPPAPAAPPTSTPAVPTATLAPAPTASPTAPPPTATLAPSSPPPPPAPGMPTSGAGGNPAELLAALGAGLALLLAGGLLRRRPAWRR